MRTGASGGCRPDVRLAFFADGLTGVDGASSTLAATAAGREASGGRGGRSWLGLAAAATGFVAAEPAACDEASSAGGLASAVSGPVAGTTDPTLFQDGRMPGDSGPLVYSFPVANGSYHANLYFAELYGGDEFVGGRVFNVKVGGMTVLQNFDIFKTAGANTALVKGVDFAVTNGVATKIGRAHV